MEEVELNDNDDREGRGCEQLQQQAGFGVLTQTEVVEPRRREICEQFTVGRVCSVNVISPRTLFVRNTKQSKGAVKCV